MPPSLEFEAGIRVACFAGVFAAMAVWELLAPRRKLTVQRPWRWTSNLGLVFLKLAGGFFMPLLISPPLAIVASGMVYPVFRTVRHKLGISAETCLCVGNEVVEIVPAASMAIALQRAEQLTVRMGDMATCEIKVNCSACRRPPRWIVCTSSPPGL